MSETILQDIFNPAPESVFTAKAEGRIEYLRKLPKSSHIHILGICGSGTGSLAALLKEQGYQVSGSDKAFYPPMGDFVKQHADRIFESFSASNLDQKPDFIVIGNALSRGNVELEEALLLKIPFCSMSEAFSALLLLDEATTSVVVSGTHGKTTTTAALAHVLSACGLSPGYFLGGVPESSELDGPVRMPEGPSPISIFEGDEYDSAFFAKYAKFFCYRPNILIITNIEFDHGDIYEDLVAIENAFLDLLLQLPNDAIVVACANSEVVTRVVKKGLDKRKDPFSVIWYGSEVGADLRVLSRTQNAVSSGPSFAKQVVRFSMFGKELEFRTGLSGEHNVLNLLAVIAVSKKVGLTYDSIKDAIETFVSVKRRQQLVFSDGNTVLIEDFAHHPTEVSATLSGIREVFPNKKILVFFEPRSNTSRRAFFLEEYLKAFAVADYVLIKEVSSITSTYAKVNEGVGLLDVPFLVAELSRTSKISAYSSEEILGLISFMKEKFEPGMVLVVMSNGSFDGILPQLVNFLEAQG